MRATLGHSSRRRRQETSNRFLFCVNEEYLVQEEAKTSSCECGRRRRKGHSSCCSQRAPRPSCPVNQNSSIQNAILDQNAVAGLSAAALGDLVRTLNNVQLVILAEVCRPGMDYVIYCRTLSNIIRNMALDLFVSARHRQLRQYEILFTRLSRTTGSLFSQSNQ